MKSKILTLRIIRIPSVLRSVIKLDSERTSSFENL